MRETEVYLDSIRETYPDFCIEKAQAHTCDGQFNDILIINDEFIFRFPRYSESIAGLITEVQLLETIRGYVSLPIPNPVYSNLAIGTAHKVFMGYHMIQGEPLWPETLAAITDSRILHRIANQLASFLKELHSVPIESLSKDLPVHDTLEQWKKMYADIRQNLFCFMRPDAQAWVREHFESFLNNPRLLRHRICLRHGDFGASNILFNRETQTISGIIDFDELGLGDPASDIAAASCYGEQLLGQFSAAHPEVESMSGRAQFYKGTYALQEALHGFKNNDHKAFESGMAEYV